MRPPTICGRWLLFALLAHLLAIGPMACEDESGESAACRDAEQECDGRDDDCDGETDEGLSQPCDADGQPGLAWCVDGAWSGCSSAALAEAPCDEIDNDADGETDESEVAGTACVARGGCGAGSWECGAGGALVCSAAPGGSEARDEPERCDGVDNDCDGETDEGFLPEADCQGLRGVCAARRGRYECTEAGVARCSVDPGGSESPATEEICDGADNDCDGETDEGFDIGAPCEAPGRCGPGHLECAGPTATRCWSAPGGSRDGSGPESCNGLDDDCNGLVDDLPAVGTPCTGDLGVCAQRPGVLECAGDGLRCTSSRLGSSPGSSDETCDGVDNDCDGLTDEALTQACETPGGAGTQRCEAGAWQACESIGGGAELPCNRVDDDGDGETDEGFGVGEACVGEGACGEGHLECAGVGDVRCSTLPGGSADASTEELCDGVDNDCNGLVDDLPVLGNPCTGEVGICAQTLGALECRAGGVVCSSSRLGSASGASDEACDDLDNDCDGLTDEELTRPCEADDGPGSERCEAGAWLPCDVVEELCDQLDDDGDGGIDEGFGVGEPCPGEGACGGGLLECAGVRDVRCSTMPGGSADASTEEVCDGVDNDCDGETDEGLQTRVFRDEDEDGHGDAAVSMPGCVPLPGWSLLDDDCDDSDVARFPGGIEVCDGIDNDCDGAIDDGEVCPDPVAANLDPLTQDLYVVGVTGEHNHQGLTIQAVWPELGPGPTQVTTDQLGSGLTFRPTDQVLYMVSDDLPYPALRVEPDGSTEEVIASPDLPIDGRRIAFDADGVLYYASYGRVQRSPSGETVLLSCVPFATVLADGRVVCWKEAERDVHHLVVYDGDGVEVSRLAPLDGQFVGTMAPVERATTVAGNRAYFLYHRCWFGLHCELVSFRLAEDSSWSLQRRIPDRQGTVLLALSDGTVLLTGRDDETGEWLIRGLRADNTEEVIWRGSDTPDLDVESVPWLNIRVFLGLPR